MSDYPERYLKGMHAMARLRHIEGGCSCHPHVRTHHKWTGEPYPYEECPDHVCAEARRHPVPS